MPPDIAEYGVFTMESGNNKRLMFEKGVKTYTNHWVERIEAGKVRLNYLYRFGPDLIGPSTGSVPRRDNGGEFDLEIDAVILVTARRSEDRLWRELKARKAEWAANGVRDDIPRRRLQGARATQSSHVGCSPAGARI